MRLVYKVHLDCRREVSQEVLELQEQLVQLVCLELLVQVVGPVSLVTRACLDHRVLKAVLVLLALKVIKELSEYKVLKDWQVLRELPELLV